MTENVAKQADDAVRAEKAMRLRVRGAHWAEVAQACGYPSPAAALRAVGDYKAAAVGRADETADELRDTANLQLQALLKVAWDLVDDEYVDLDGNTAPAAAAAIQLRAIDEARRIVEAQVKLNQLDKAQEERQETDRIVIVGLDPRDLV